MPHVSHDWLPDAVKAVEAIDGGGGGDGGDGGVAASWLSDSAEHQALVACARNLHGNAAGMARQLPEKP